MELSSDYWETRYQENNTGWDLQKASQPLVAYFDQLSDKNMKILIPGGGYNYEAEYLFKKGFKNIYILDFARTALDSFKNRDPSFPSSQLLEKDFFDLEERFDLIIEQTFFCALDPSLREKYVEQMSSCLNVNGKLVGLLFNRHFENGPPFGGSKKEYEALFQKEFNILTLESCYNSETPRQDAELFFRCIKL